MIGNTDGHLKNYSLPYSEDQKTVRLTPGYNVINTIGYKDMTHEMTFAIDYAKLTKDVTPDSCRFAAKETGFGERMALNHQGVKGIEELKDTILKSSIVVQ